MRFFRRTPPPALVPVKRDLIDLAFSRFDVRSFADLGAVWGVEGGYTFYALEKYRVAAAVLVDTDPTDTVKRRARGFPQLTVITGNFGDEWVVRQVGNVDAVCLFDVLLHQAPDWDRVLEMYAHQTRCFIIYNPQWIGSNRTVRLLELGEDEYFRNVPHGRHEGPYAGLFEKLDEISPHQSRPWRNAHSIWQWGITDADLRTKVESLGFSLQFTKNYGRFSTLENFENHGFVFSK